MKSVPLTDRPPFSPLSGEITLFGLPADRGRWLLIPLGAIAMICLGTVYSWSVFRIPLQKELDLSATQSTLPFTLLLLLVAPTMPIAGIFIDRYGSRLALVIGAILMGLGYIGSGLAANFSELLLAYGVLAGIGGGIAYGAPIAAIARWFPDRKGIALGLTVVGFGLSPFVTAPLAEFLLDLWDISIALRVLGLGFIIILCAIALFLKRPETVFLPTAISTVDWHQRISIPPLLKRWVFYGLFIGSCLGTSVGFLAIGISAPVAEEMVGFDAKMAAFFVSFFAIFNGLGRPLFGWITERFTPKIAAIVSFVGVLLASGGMLLVNSDRWLLYPIAFAIFWLSLGSWVAIALTTVLMWFNPQDYAKNVGILWLSHGVGSIIGPIGAGMLRDRFGSYEYSFIFTAILAAIGIIVALFLLDPPQSRDKVK